jgi:hypothetical protein
VARRRPARRVDRGGVLVQASRASVARLATAAGAVATALGLAVYGAAAAEHSGEPLAAAGGLGVVAMLAAVTLGWNAAVPAALVLLAAEYLAGIGTGGHEELLEPAAPLVAGALLLAAELAYWSLELRGPGHEERELVLRRLVALGVLTVLAIALGSFVVVVTAAPFGGGLAWDVVGVAAAAATLAVVALLARRDVGG